MYRVRCSFCEKVFYKKKSQIAYCKNNFCSPACQYKAARKGEYIKCFTCGKSIYKSKKELLRSKSKKYFCSHMCSNLYISKNQVGSGHPNWKGGMFSYRNMLKRQKLKEKCLLCFKKDSRILVVHHIDKNRKNNNLDNLMWLCRNCHFLVHNYKNESKKIADLVKV